MRVAPLKQDTNMTDLNNDARELSINELNTVSGGADKPPQPKNPKPTTTPGHFEVEDFSFDT
jgi:bacteriocin-like protein